MNPKQTKNAVYETGITPQEIPRLSAKARQGSHTFICSLNQKLLIGGKVEQKEYQQHLKLTLGKAKEILSHYNALPRFLSRRMV